MFFCSGGSRFRMFSLRMVFIFYGVVLFLISNEALLFFLFSFFLFSFSCGCMGSWVTFCFFWFSLLRKCGCREGFDHCFNYIFLVFQVCMLVDAWVGATSYSFPSFYFWCSNCLSHLPKFSLWFRLQSS